MLDPGLCVFSIRYYLRIIFKCVNLASSSCKFIERHHNIYNLLWIDKKGNESIQYDESEE